MPLKLGMLGMWHTHAHGVVREVAEHADEFTLVGFHDPDPELAADRRKQWEPRLPGFRHFDSAAQLLQQPLDGVVIEGRVFENLKLARMALEAGRPVLLEKPAGTDLKEYRQLIDLAQRKHLHVQMLYLFRYMPAVRELRKRQGELGRIYQFRARLPKPLGEYQRFVEELKPYPGGIFFEMAGHIIDLMVALLGKPRSVTPFLAHHHVQPPKEYVDNGVAVCGFESAWGILEVPALEVAAQSRRIEVYGTEGAFVIPHLGSGHLPNQKVQVVELFRKGDDAWRRSELPDEPLHLRDLREFAAVLAGKKAPDYGMEHDLAVQEILLRASGMDRK
jgi:predicted dehydrogenase